MKPKLSFITTSEGFTITQNKYQMGWMMPYIHHHSYHEIYILEYGERLVRIDNKEILATAYQATFFPGNIPHKSSGTSAFGGICICFEESYLEKYLTKTSQKQLLKCFETTIVNLTEKEYARVKEIANAFTPFKKNNYIRLIELLDILNTAAEHTVPQNIMPLQYPAAEKSQLISKYIDEHFRTIKTAKEVTELFDVSESYFFKSFKKLHSVSPRQYINNLKLRHACYLLIHRLDRSSKSISADSGFESYEHFMRLFKQKIGCTPLEYRKSHKQ